MLFHKAPKGAFFVPAARARLTKKVTTWSAMILLKSFITSLRPVPNQISGFVAVTSANQSRSSALLHAIASSAIPF